MFFCTGCQNVQAIEPSPAAPAAAPAPAAPAAAAIPVASEPDAELDAVVGLAVESDNESVIEKPAVTGDDKHPPLPISRASTPDASADADAEADAEADADAEAEGVNIIGGDTRMPVNRVSSSFDESIYSQEFTVHKVPSSNLTIRAYEDDSDTYVTIDITEPITLPIATLREVLNSIQPDPEKKRLGDSLMLMIGCLFASILLHARD
jgi:hypothetical protein